MGYSMKGFSGFGNSPIKQKDDLPKSFNYKGSSWHEKTPGYESTKAAKHKQSFDKFQTQVKKGKKFVKNLKAKGDLVSKKPSGNITQALKGVKKVLKQAKTIRTGLNKITGKVIAPLGVGATLYDMYKSGQKHSGGKAVKGQKSFMEDAKKKTKSIFKKKDRY